ncbi:MAG: SpoIIE family protein phosphatase [Acidimicrobiia bacterium]
MGNPLEDEERLLALRASGLHRGTHQAAFEPLLDLATRLLGTPVGLVSLVDDQAQHFAAELGLGEPGNPMGGTPLSHSFCQHVVVDDAPLVVSDARLDDRLAGHPAIADLGVIAYCGVPIRDHEGHVLGSFCAIDTEEHAWSAGDVEVLRTLAEAVAATVSVELRHSSLIRSLQRRVHAEAGASSTSAWRLDAAYRPAAHAAVGGDFYDVEDDQDGGLSVILGDVVGHGLDATVAMAQLQAATRTAASIGGSLGEVVEVLDRAAPSIDGVSFAAVVVAGFDADGRGFQHLSCGALPTLVVGADGTARFCEDAQTPPLAFPGAVRRPHRHDEDVAGVVFATDGLIERRGESLQVGLDRLASLAPHVMGEADPAAALADALGGDSDDDVAVVVVRPDR